LHAVIAKLLLRDLAQGGQHAVAERQAGEDAVGLDQGDGELGLERLQRARRRGAGKAAAHDDDATRCYGPRQRQAPSRQATLSLRKVRRVVMRPTRLRGEPGRNRVDLGIVEALGDAAHDARGPGAALVLAHGRRDVRRLAAGDARDDGVGDLLAA